MKLEFAQTEQSGAQPARARTMYPTAARDRTLGMITLVTLSTLKARRTRSGLGRVVLTKATASALHSSRLAHLPAFRCTGAFPVMLWKSFCAARICAFVIAKTKYCKRAE